MTTSTSNGSKFSSNPENITDMITPFYSYIQQIERDERNVLYGNGNFTMAYFVVS